MRRDMVDKELSYWTAREDGTAGFLVATIGTEVVGTVAYYQQV